MRARTASRSTKADRAVPRHARGRAGRGQQHARRLPARPRPISRRFLGRSGKSFADADTDDLRAYLGRPRHARLQVVQRGAAAVGDPAAVSLPLSEAHRGDDPAAILSGPKRGRSLPKVLSIADVDRLLAQAQATGAKRRSDAGAAAARARLYCLLEVLYATGLRVSELVALPLSAARRDARMIVVRGKGNKERLVPLNDAARQAMADYLARWTR